MNGWTDITLLYGQWEGHARPNHCCGRHRDIERKRAKERKTDTVRKEQNLGRQREREKA